MENKEGNDSPERTGPLWFKVFKAQLLQSLRDGPGQVLALYLKVLNKTGAGRMSRRYWKAFAAFWILATIVAMLWPWHLSADTSQAPEFPSWTWWTTPVEMNAWKKFPAFVNATFTVSEFDQVKQRAWVAGENGLLGYRDIQGSAWTLLPYDTETGCFGAPGALCTASAPATQAADRSTTASSSPSAGLGTSASSASPGKTRASKPNSNPANVNPPASRSANQVAQQSPAQTGANAPQRVLAVSIVSLTEGQTLSGVVMVQAAVSGASGPVKIELRLDLQIAVGGAVEPPYTISFDTRKFPNGKHQLTATATSADGATAYSKPLTILISNAAAKAAAASLRAPGDYPVARFQLASFSARDGTPEGPAATRSAAPAVSRQAAKGILGGLQTSSELIGAEQEWLRTTIPSVVGLDLGAKPSAILVASDGRFFESSDDGNTWTLSRKVGAASTVRPFSSEGHKVGRRRFYLSEASVNGQLLNTEANRVSLAGGAVFQAVPGNEGVEVVEAGKKVGDKLLPGEKVQSVAATKDGKYIWFAARGADGTTYIERSDDLGKTWKTQFQTNKFILADVSFDPAGRYGVAVGDHGAILLTVDEGNYWAPVTRGAANPDAERAAEQADASGGSAPRDANGLLFLHYWKLPPPWTFMLLLLALGAATPAIALAYAPLDASRMPGSQTIADFLGWWNLATEPSPQQRPSVANEALSDSPLQSADKDQLQFTPLAQGVSGFLSNPNTLLPVTIAIQGGWGTGKSSLMNLLRDELTKIKFRPVWFNAWHHQEDENLLASMLQTVRNEAVPGFFSTTGMWFRVHLAWHRMRRNLQGILGMVFVLAVLCSAESYWHHIPHHAMASAMARWNGKIQEQASNISHVTRKPEGTDKTTSPAPAGETLISSGRSITAGSALAPGEGAPAKSSEAPSSLLGYLLALLVNFYSLLHVFFEPAEALSLGTYVTGPLPALYVILRIIPSAWKQLRAFGENPANLLHSAAPGASNKQLDAQTSFRTKFAKQFEDVTLSLGDGHRLVIFVDDLDRCRPEKVGEMLEDLNYIVTAGPCAVVLGIEDKAVRAALGLNFRETAEEREEVNDVDPANLSAVAHAKREKFAERYIEKLINIELNVPQPTESELTKLLKAAEARKQTRPQRRAQTAIRWGRRLEPLLVGLILAALGWGVGEGAVGFANWRAEVGLGKSGLVVTAPATKLREVTAQATSSSQSNLTAQNSAAQSTTAPGGRMLPPPETKRAALPMEVAAEPAFPGLWLTGWRLWVTLPAFVLALLWPATRERRRLAKDSRKFEDAREAWAPVIIQRFQTPRAIKRFLNRVRYLAMLEHPARQPLPFLEEWFAGRAPANGSQVEGMPEDVLVALASFEAVDPRLVEDPQRTHDVLTKLDRTIRLTVEATLKTHHKVFANANQFAEYIRAYADLIRGIGSQQHASIFADADAAAVKVWAGYINELLKTDGAAQTQQVPSKTSGL
ncbi:MAG TPA: P-loop NTPase fold protein [Terriglobales bacterium]|nr:P-loop NTPase fold protein [Terriglobales bacterium]